MVVGTEELKQRNTEFYLCLINGEIRIMAA